MEFKPNYGMTPPSKLHPAEAGSFWRAVIARYKYCRHEKDYLASLMLGIIILGVGVSITFAAIIYASNRVSLPVTDIILSNIPPIDVDALFVYAPIVFWFVTGIYLVIRAPASLPFVLKSLGLFMLIRSFFISLTHIGLFPLEAPLKAGGILSIFTSGGDQFFSSHTGMPFLMALMFWHNKKLRWLFLASSIFFGIVVLLGHYHYSIDVFAAFFITYGISHITILLFRRDWNRFMASIS